MKSKNYSYILVVGIIINCVLLAYNLQLKFKNDATLGDEPSTTSSTYVITLPEARITNMELSDFAKNTLIPRLRDLEFDTLTGVVKLLISKFYDDYSIKFVVYSIGSIANDTLSDEFVQAVCLIEDYPIIVEAPADCPFIEVLNNYITMEHDGDEFFKLTACEWCFYAPAHSQKLIDLNY